ncbi:MAG: HEPN domain-containing protein [Prevotella sp.]|nr:HEPN domain-containing protein [Prevotella sp.]
MSLDPETRSNTVVYRIEKAKKTWDDALFCIEGKRWNMASNRLYYAVFHAVSALLISNNIPANTHRGFLRQMNFHLINNKKLMTPEEGQLVRQLFGMRHEDDYEDFIDITEEQIKEYLPRVQNLIDKLIRITTTATTDNPQDSI